MQEITEHEIGEKRQKQESFAVFLYTPLCGTCKVGERMLSILLAMQPALPLWKCNVNYVPALAREWKVESVPCLIGFKQGDIVRKEYAMRSVDHLYTILQEVTSHSP